MSWLIELNRRDITLSMRIVVFLGEHTLRSVSSAPGAILQI